METEAVTTQHLPVESADTLNVFNERKIIEKWRSRGIQIFFF